MEKYFRCEIDDYEQLYSEDEMVERVSEIDDIWENEDLTDAFNENNEGANICGEYYSASEIYSALKGEDALSDELYEIARSIADDRAYDARYTLRRLNEVGETSVIGDSWRVRLAEIRGDVEDEMPSVAPNDMEEEFSRLLIGA